MNTDEIAVSRLEQLAGRQLASAFARDWDDVIACDIARERVIAALIASKGDMTPFADRLDAVAAFGREVERLLSEHLGRTATTVARQRIAAVRYAGAVRG